MCPVKTSFINIGDDEVAVASDMGRGRVENLDFRSDTLYGWPP